jgi:hypothetical protein
LELPESTLGRALRIVRLNNRARDAIKFLRENNRNDMADAIAEICNEWMERQNAVDVVEAYTVAKEQAVTGDQQS